MNEAWNVKLKAPKRAPARPECNCYLHGDIGAYDSCSHFVAIVMLIQIRLQSGTIVCYMIQILVYLLDQLPKTAIIKESTEKSWIIDTNYKQETLF